MATKKKAKEKSKKVKKEKNRHLHLRETEAKEAKKDYIEEISVSEKKVNIKKKFDKRAKSRIKIAISFFASLFIGTIIFIFGRNLINSIIFFVLILVLFGFYFFVRARLKKLHDIKKIEDVFPDFIEMMSSNLRAGMTIDRALLLSSRKEFAPLDKEILQLGKDIVTGREINKALEDMAVRINSEKIKKTVALIISGIRSGGNLSVLLEETAINMRERGFIEKRASSNVLMYVIFVFFAVAIGAPLLFALSSVLVQILSNVLSNLPNLEQVNVNLPFTLSKINVPVNFVVYFTLTFIIIIDILASFILGLVNKGKEKEGLKYIVPLVTCGVTVFFLTRYVLLRYFADFFGG